MSSVDERIVEMRFDNKDFEENVQTTMNTLDKLKSALKLTDASKSFENIEKAASEVSFDSIADSLESIENRFSTFGIIGMRVLENLTDAAMRTASKIASFVTNAVIGGGIKRAMNIENARFQLQGLLKDEEAVAAVMDNVNDAVSGTAYSYDAAAKVASQLAASGLAAGDEMYEALRGIAGVAAMTNSSYEDIGQIYATVAGNGRLMATELRRLSIRGMNAAAVLGEQLGYTESDIRDLVRKGQISFADFSAAMMEAFGEHAEKANETFTGVLSNVRAALARTGAKFVAPLIEQNGELVQMFNSIRLKINEFNGAIDPIANTFTNAVKSMARSADYYISQLDIGTRIKDRLHVLNLWNEFGGFKTFAEGMSYVLEAIVQRVSAIADAFHDVFFGKQGNLGAVLTATRNFKDFAQSLLLTEDQVTGIKFVFSGLFRVLKIGIDIVKGIIKIVFKPISLLIGLAEILEHVVLSVVGAIANFYYKIKDAVKNSEAFAKVVDSVRDAIHKLKNWFDFGARSGELFAKIGEKLGNFFEWISKPLGEVSEDFNALDIVLSAAATVFGGVVSAVGAVKDGIIEFAEAFEKTEFVQMIEGWITSIENFWDSLDIGSVVGGYFQSFIGWLKSLSDKEITLPEVNMEGIAKDVSDFLIRVGDALKKVGSWIETNTKPVIDFFKKVGKKIKELFTILTGPAEGKKEKLVEYFKNLGTSISNFYKEIKTNVISKLKEFWQYLKDTGGNILPNLSKAFEDAKQYIRDFVGEETFKKIENFVTLLKELKDNIIGKITGKSDDAGSSLEELGKKIGEFFKQIDIKPQTLLAIGLLVFLGVLISNIAKILGYMKKITGAISGLMTTLKSKLAGILAQNTKILQLAIFVGVVAASINALSKIPAKKLKTTVVWLSVAVGILAGVFVALQYLTNLIYKKFKGKGPKLETVALSLLVFVGTILLVMVAIKQAAELVESKNLAESIGLIVVIMGILIGAGYLLQKIKMTNKTVAGMLALAIFAFSIGRVFSALNDLAKETGDPNKLAGFVWAIVPLMIGLGVLAVGAGQVSLPSAVALVVIAKMLQVVLPMLSGLTDEDIAGIKKFVNDNIALFIVLGVLGAVMLALSAKYGKQVKNAGTGIVAIGAAFYVIAMAIEKLGNMNAAKLEQGLSTIAIIALIIAIFEAISRATRFNAFPKFAKGMLILSAVFVVFALVIKILSKLDDAAVMKGIITIVAFGIILAVLTGLSALTKKAKVGPIIAIAATLVVLGGILIALSLIPWDDLWHAAVAFGGVLILLGIAFGIIFAKLKKITKSNSIGLIYMVGMLATVALIGGILYQLSKQDWANLLVAGIAMALCLGVVAYLTSAIVDLAKASKKGSEKNAWYLAAMIGVIGAIGASLYFVSKNPWRQILAAGGAMALALGAFGLACKALEGLATAKSLNMAGLAYIVAMIVVMGVIAVALGLLADKPWESLIAAGAGMSLVLIALAGCVAALSLIKANPAQIIAQAAGVVCMSLALLVIGYAMSYIVGFPTEQIYAAAVAMGGIMGVMAGVIAILGSLPINAGIAAAANVIEFVGLLLVFFLGLAEIIAVFDSDYGGLEKAAEIITKLGLIFEAIGYALGSIITGLLKAIGEGVDKMMSYLPSIAASLDAFMTKMSGVYSVAAFQKDTAIDKLEKIIQSVMSVSSFSVTKDNIDNFKNAAGPFSEAIKSYAENISKISKGDIARAGLAAKLAQKVVDVCNAIPKEGGWLDGILGISDLDKFSSQMTNFGDAVVSFCGSIQYLTNGDKKHAEYAYDVAKPIVDIASSLGRNGGLIETFLGKQLDLTTFGLQMVAFGVALNLFASEIKDFGNYSTAVSNVKAVTDPMIEIAGSLGNSGGIIETFVGKKTTIDDFGTQIKTFAESLVSYCSTINDESINLVRMNAVTDAISKLAATFSDISDLSAGGLDVFEDNLEAVGNMSISTVIDELWAYKDALIENLDQIFSEAASHIETTNQPEMVEKASGIVKAMCEGIKSTTSVTNMTSAIKTLMTNSKTGFNSATSDGYNAGKNFIQGFINGLRGTNQYALTAVYSIGRSLFYEFKRSLDEKSPSRATYEAGEFFIEGFINGLSNMEKAAKKKVSSVATGTVGLLNDAVSKAVDYMDENMDASPVIRPVLDLSSVSAGTYAMQNMFGGYSMNFATRTSGDVRASQESQTRLDDLSERLDTAISKIGEIIQNESDMAANTNYQFEIPFAIDGRELARASAVYNQEELNRLTRNMQRKKGYR